MSRPAADGPASARRTNLVFGIVLAVLVLLSLMPSIHDYWGDHRNHFEPVGDLVGAELGRPFPDGEALVAALKAIVDDEDISAGMFVAVFNGDTRPKLYSYCTQAEYRSVTSALEAIRAAHTDAATGSVGGR